MQINVVILDNYPIIRNGLKMIVESQPGFKVTGEATSTGELPELFNIQMPDVLVINLSVSINHDLSVLKKIIDKNHGVHCVILSKAPIEPVILECVNNGIHAILQKDNSAEQLVEAILSVTNGEPYLELPLSRVKSKILQHIHHKQAEHLNSAELTERETEVLKLFAEGLTYKEIGYKLFISPRTVETHKNNILTKLELHSVVELVKFAIKHQLINL
jgi:DNA-binding NarL/FixJ family response regulator